MTQKTSSIEHKNKRLEARKRNRQIRELLNNYTANQLYIFFAAFEENELHRIAKAINRVLKDQREKQANKIKEEIEKLQQKLREIEEANSPDEKN